MYRSFNIVAFIGARAGSKSIKNKNIIDFSGQPLIHWTIDAAVKSEYVDRTIVSTDGEQIARVAKESGADVPFMRPAELAQDDSPTQQALDHCFHWLEKNEKQKYDYIVLLQPTSPLRTTRHIDEAISYYFEHKRTDKDTLISVSPAPRKLGWLMQENKEGYISRCIDSTKDVTRRQDLPEYYLPNGAIYFGPISVVKEKGFHQGHVLPFVMNERDSVDIDSQEDLSKALALFDLQRKVGKV